MSVNGWIKLLSIMLGVDIAKRLDLVAINYDALNDLLDSIDKRGAKVLQLRIDEGKTLKEIGDLFHVSRERMRQIQDKAIRQLGSRSRVQMLHRAISGWWNLTEKTIAVKPVKARAAKHDANKQADYQSCLVITNYNKPRVRTNRVVVEVEKVVKVPGEEVRVDVFRQPKWHEVKAGLPQHADRVFVMDWNATEKLTDELVIRGLMWFATFDSKSGAFLCNDGVPRATITHWCELPVFGDSTAKRWDSKLGRFVSSFKDYTR